MRQIADKVGAMFLVDMAHFAGLVAGGAHPSPVPHAHIVTSTTHKTLRGPRSGLILSKAEFAAAIDKVVFPGMQGGPLVHIIAAKAICFQEAMQSEFRDYAKQVVANAKVLAATLAEEGFRIISGGTDTHLMLVDVFSKGMLGSEAEKALGEAGITVNKNAIPFDTNPPMKPSGIRIGSPALTTRGMKEDGDAAGGTLDRGRFASPDGCSHAGKNPERSSGLMRSLPAVRGAQGEGAGGSSGVAHSATMFRAAAVSVVKLACVKIAIDIRRMTEFGVGTYIRNVVRTLGRLDLETTYFLIGSPAKVKEIGPLPPNFHTVPLAEPERSLKSFREFRAIVKRLECDLVHIPNLFSVPRLLPCPYVMTVHDMLEHLSRARQQTGFWGSLHFQLTKRALRGASRIFAVSNFTKLEMEKLFGIPSGQIEVVYNAIDERFLHGHASAADRQLIAERYQVTYPFLALCRKNQSAQERGAHDRGVLRA